MNPAEPQPTPGVERLMAEIAREHLQIETLETHKSDDLDFHDLAVWTIRDALLAAYQAGLAAANQAS